MPKIHYVYVLGGTDLEKYDEFQNAAYNLCVTLAARKLHLVYREGVQGLQEYVAGTAITRGSKVLSIALKNRNISNLILSIEFKVSIMQQCMSRILLNFDAFIALPSGILSLQEVMSIVFWANGNFHQKLLGFLNVNSFYDRFLSYLNHAVE